MARLGILAGGGMLPRRLIEHCQKQHREFFVLAFEGQTETDLVAGVPHGWTRFGTVERSFSLLHEAGVSEIVLAGNMRRPSASELRPDLKATKILAKVGLLALGDDGLLRAVKNELEREGFTLISPQEVVADLIAIDGVYGRHQPDQQADADIARGFEVASHLGTLDIGQAVTVQQGVVLGIEAIEGTDALIARSGPLQRGGPGGVLVKASKPGQERRMDLPTIGLHTVGAVHAAGLRGIAVEAGGALVMERDDLIALADQLGIFIVGRKPGIKPPLFYLIAGEPSGDALGARLMAALVQRTGGNARFAGIGGDQMKAAGIDSLLPINGLAIMGVFEVLPAAFRVLRWVRQTADDIRRLRPDAVITIDSSGFCFRVAERLRRQRNPPLIIHYVAPMVWAWRAHRVKYAAAAADHLLTLLPFEPPYFEKVGLATTFVGHSAVEDIAGDGAAFRARHDIPADATVICVLPGSRKSEVRVLLPVFQATVARLAATFPRLVVAVPTVETVVALVIEATRQAPVRTIVVQGVVEKRDAFAASNVALAASGTVALELAIARVPMVVSYRIAPILAYLYRKIVQTKFYTLVNILLNRDVVPELVQEACTPEILSAALENLLSNAAAKQVQLDAFDAVIGQLTLDGKPPSLVAADKVLSLVAERMSAAP